MKEFKKGDKVMVINGYCNASDFNKGHIHVPLLGIYGISNWVNIIFEIEDDYKPVKVNSFQDIYGAYPLSLNGEIKGYVYNNGLKLANREVLLSEAKLRYPIGATVKCLYNNRKYLVADQNYETHFKEQIWFLTDDDIGIKIYADGVWAEIVSFPEKEFILPETWYIKVNEENNGVLSKWYYNDNNCLQIGVIVGMYYSLSNNKIYKGFNPCSVLSGKTYKFENEITFEQFKKYVLKEKEDIMKKQTFKITRVQFYLIYNVACNTWKDKIEAMVDEKLGVFGDECTLSYKEVETMFKAATNTQLSTLGSIFPDFKRLPMLTMSELVKIVGYDFKLID